jgi:thiol:disulfide interchange protein DsbD
MKAILKILILVISFFLLPQPAFAATQNIDITRLSKQAQTTPDAISKLKAAVAGQESFLYLMMLAFLAGVLISFTPCVYPMIPITAGILQTQATTSLLKNFLAALFYVLGLALVYASLGVIAASTSIIFGQWTANPFFILFIIFLFLYLAFSLFGFYEIRMPQFITSTPGSQAQGSLAKSFLLGLFSGAVASPCITPALAVLLTLVADKGNPVLGFFALFFFAIGMGTLLMIVGTFSTMLNLLPGSGAWMLKIKSLLGFTMLVMCVYFAKPLLPSFWINLLYLTVGLILAGYLVIKIFKAVSTNPTYTK